MEFQTIKLRGVTFSVYYTKSLGWNDDMTAELEIYNILSEGIEMYDLCEYYNILPDIYEQLWKHI